MAVAGGRDARPHHQHRVRVEPEGRDVPGDGEVPPAHQEDLPQHRHKHQDHPGLAAREKLLESKSEFC